MDIATEQETLPITILDYVKSKLGEKETYSYADHIECGVPMMGGCRVCHATIATYNAYPTKIGFLACADCVGATGFATVEEFGASIVEDDDEDDEGDLDEYDGYDAEYED